MTYRFGRGARTGALLRRPSGVVVSSAADAPDAIFGAALEGWWRGDTVTTTGSLVDQMDDLSGNARHMVQTGSARPTTTTAGGQDAVRFDPTSAAQYLATSGTQSIGLAPWALWAVYLNNAVVSAGMTLVVYEPSVIELRQGASRVAQLRCGATSIRR